jgi:hypothetical protein
VKRRAYDWSGSQSVLPFVDMPKFNAEFKLHKQAFDDLADAFVAKYPSIVANMAFIQGDMFDRNNYPDAALIRNKFRVELYTSEIPLGDFRCAIAQDLADDLFNNYSKQAQTIIDGIMRKQAEQFINVMTSISHCCGVDETTDKNGEIKTKKRKIYDTTITKALEYCETFKSFNLTNNQPLEEARQALEGTLRGLNVDMLKESTAVRETVKNDIDDILAKFRPRAGV